jgi:membrane associated rhomboid family serine protease
LNQQPTLQQVTRPPIALGIIGVCVVLYFLPNLFQQSSLGNVINNFLNHMALWPLGGDNPPPWKLDFQPLQLITYGFLHGSFNHLFFNMFALWMFGLPVERFWGTRKFLEYYFICILGAGLVQLLVQYISGGNYPTIGASGAVFGLLLAYGVTWPNAKLFLIFFPVPIKAKWFVLIYGAAELVFGVTGAMPQVAHYAHLGGLFFGAGLLWRWGWRPGMTWN